MASNPHPVHVSVCMAVYNGAHFLRAQIESILQQLKAGDELIVVDDASDDASLLILRDFGDPRLRVHCNATNIGVLATFEKALRLAKGEIIFLSDQDDVWAPGKIEKALQIFGARPEVTMVVTDATVIDEHGQILNASFFSRRGRFSPGVIHNFLRNKYLGCTLSFRREMLPAFLPIPPDVPMHDIWFGILNQIYGSAHFIDEPLVGYRRHARNATPATHGGLLKMATWRWRLAKSLLMRVASRPMKRASGT